MNFSADNLSQYSDADLANLRALLDPMWFALPSDVRQLIEGAVARIRAATPPV